MHNNDNCKLLQNRVHHNEIQLQVNLDTCKEIQVKDLFVPDPTSRTTPVRCIVLGKAGIGKSLLCLRIVDMWLKGELLPKCIHDVFLLRLRDLTGIGECSLEDIFFTSQGCQKPSPEATGVFFKQLFTNPARFLLILDGLDEIQIAKMDTRVVYEYNQQVETPRLIASIINGWTIPSTRVLVTSRNGCSMECDKIAEIYGFTRRKMSDYIEKFSGVDEELKKAIESYIDRNVNISNICYIPIQLNMTCHIVKERLTTNDALPETLTELFVGFVENFLIL